MNFFTYLRHISVRDAYIIMLYAALGGISGGALLILYPNAAIHIFDPGKYRFYLCVIPPISLIFLIAKKISQKKTAQVIEKNLEDQILSIMNTIRHDEPADFEKRKRADIHMSMVYAQTVTQAATKTIDTLEHHLTLIIGWLYIFIFLSPVFGWVILVWRLLQYLLREAFQQIIKSIVVEEHREHVALVTIFQSFLYGFKELKLSRKKSADLFDTHFIPQNDRIKKLRLKSSFYASELMLFYSLSLLILIAGGVFLLFPALTRETTLKIVIVMLYMMKTDIMILTQMPSILEGKAAMERLRHLFLKSPLKGKDDMLFDPNQQPHTSIASIILEEIHFSYAGAGMEKGFGLDIDHMRILAGETLFIVGGNGSGKSTLLRMITGLYRPSSGKILIDGQPSYMPEHRYLFSAVFNDPHLFDRLYGLEGIGEERVNALLKEMQIENKVQYRDGRFNTLNLSTGQRKRLSLVVALLEDKPVYVFDEWAADQDPFFRRYFYEQILPLLRNRGKAVIVITHDDSYFRLADQVIRMESGRIIEAYRPGKRGASESSMVQTESGQTGDTLLIQEESLRRTFHRSRGKRKIQQPPLASPGFVEQIKRLTKSHGSLIKRLLFLMGLTSFSLVFLFVTLLSGANPSIDRSRDILFFQFIILAVLFVTSFRRMNRYFYDSVENQIAEFRKNVLERVRKTTLQILERIGPAGIYTKLSSDIKAIADTSFSVLMSLLGVIRALFTFAYIAFLSLHGFLIIICLVLIGAGFYAYNHIIILKLFEQMRAQERRLFMSLNDLLDGFKELRLDNRKSDRFYEDNLKQTTGHLSEIKLSFAGYYGNNYTLAYALWEAVLLSFTFLLPIMTPSASSVLPFLVAMVVTIPLNQIIDRYSQFHTAYLSFQQLMLFEETVKRLSPAFEMEGDASGPDHYEILEYKNIAFQYQSTDGHPFLIGPLDISFKPGEILFITGGNGSGKSTLLKLITGLYPLNSGQVFLNGMETEIGAFQDRIGAIFSDFYLFDKLYGAPDIDEKRVASLLNRFKLDKSVTYREGKFSTLDLSTGQKKRLALVITLLEDKPIYIFDEWAADQDPYFKAYFYSTLLPEFKSQGKIVIVVTHDDRYFDTADRVIRMKYGQMV